MAEGFFGNELRRIEMKKGKALPIVKARLKVAGFDKTIAPGRHYQPLSFSRSGRFGAELVFAGFGIVARDYDSFEELEVKDKWVMVLRYLPNVWKKKRRDKLWNHAALRKKAAANCNSM